jgi:hypothetical protein
MPQMLAGTLPINGFIESLGRGELTYFTVNWGPFQSEFGHNVIFVLIRVGIR